MPASGVVVVVMVSRETVNCCSTHKRTDGPTNEKEGFFASVSSVFILQILTMFINFDKRERD